MQSSPIVTHALFRPLGLLASAILIAALIGQIYEQWVCDETHCVSRQLFIHTGSASLPFSGYRLDDAVSIASNDWLCATAAHARPVGLTVWAMKRLAAQPNIERESVCRLKDHIRVFCTSERRRYRAKRHHAQRLTCGQRHFASHAC
ncbi:hypothetical protein [Xanthomonas pisi]|uniref:hypothetical protein n=1 Tax=Xanthomonas pisi TaxID=56457 RepID=UPI0015E2F6E9|nr:hypothetical protein [Xanthomonas pisi]